MKTIYTNGKRDYTKERFLKRRNSFSCSLGFWKAVNEKTKVFSCSKSISGRCVFNECPKVRSNKIVKNSKFLTKSEKF